MATKPLTIIGGGLAGLTLGIALRQGNAPVQIYEAGRHPRHRVCGEFINGRGQEVLSQLGLTRLLAVGHALPARTAMFFRGCSRSPIRHFPLPGFCISRYDLDPLLAGEFKRLGGVLFEARRFPGTIAGEGIVRASGRRLHPQDDEPRWFGLKAHARGVTLTADLEMHLLAGGYVGICRLPGGEVNVCGVFRKAPGTAASPVVWREILRGPPGSVLHERLATASLLEETFCSVAGLDLRPGKAADSSEIRIGDAMTMIPPVTGNGMSMAFESASLAATPLLDYSLGRQDWDMTRRTIASAFDAAFSRRLAWAHRLQSLIMRATDSPKLTQLAFNSAWLWDFFYARTR